MLENAEPVLSRASHDTFEARAMIYAMLLNADESTRNEQRALINRMAEPGVPELMPRVYGLIQQQSQRQKLLYLDQAMPTLKAMSRSQYQRFYELIGQLIVADGSVDLLEWVIHRIVTQELYAHFVRPFRNSGHIARPAKVRKEVTVVLSLLAATGSTDQAQRQQAFQAGIAIWGDNQRQLAIEYFDYQALNQALDKLRHLNAELKAQLLDACGAAVAADGRLRDHEFALIKGIATTLDCPMPPLEAAA
jgi:uncharacterized tellurite resistance protein B-like protein